MMRLAAQSHKKYMQMALELAGKAKERTYPNPMVGAVIVKNGRVVGKGYHKKAGGAHAEVAAIKNAKHDCKGAVMYVTLEPCDHYGKTPPCTLAIISSGIKEVYFAMKDPNPLTSGKGMRRLTRHGIKVRSGLFKSEAWELNRKYVKFVTRRLPYVTIKLAESIDGRIAAPDGTSKWISSEISRKLVRRMRGTCDAIMVGIGTVIADNPFLLDEKKKGCDTKRIVVDPTLKMPERSNLIMTAKISPVIIAATDLAPLSKIKRLRAKNGVEVIVTKNKNGKVDLRDLMRILARKGIMNILVEGGARLAGGLLDEKLADEFLFFISPKILAGGQPSVCGENIKTMTQAIDLKNVRVSMSGPDIMLTGRI